MPRPLLLVFILALTPGCRAPERSKAGPDLILITVDTLRADHLGAYGDAGARTPTVDALAARGLRFDQATTSFPRTTPALASLHTGLAPAHHGSREVGQRRSGGVTLAELLSGRGYETAAVSATRVAGPRQALNTGFDHFAVLHDRPAARISRRALKLAGAADPDKPLLLWVHYADPHFPYDPPSTWEDQPPAPRCRGLVQQVEAEQLDRERLFADRDGVSSAALADCTGLYDAEIAYTDSAIGSLLGGLEALGRLERGVVIFSADHGENLGEEGLFFEHGPSLADAALRIPLIVAGPGLPSGRVDPWPVTLEDVLPTALALLGVPATQRPQVDGQDLSPRLALGSVDEAPWADRVVFAESGSALHAGLGRYLVSGRGKRRHCVNGPRFSLCQEGTEPPTLHERATDPALERDLSAEYPEALGALVAAQARWPPETARLRAVRTPELKLVESPLLAGGYGAALYDLAQDPWQQTDLGEQRPVERARLQAALDEWTATLPSLGAPDRDLETEAALRSLGYLE